MNEIEKEDGENENEDEGGENSDKGKYHLSFLNVCIQLCGLLL